MSPQRKPPRRDAPQSTGCIGLRQKGVEGSRYFVLLFGPRKGAPPAHGTLDLAPVMRSLARRLAPLLALDPLLLEPRVGLRLLGARPLVPLPIALPRFARSL